MTTRRHLLRLHTALRSACDSFEQLRKTGVMAVRIDAAAAPRTGTDVASGLRTGLIGELFGRLAGGTVPHQSTSSRDVKLTRDGTPPTAPGSISTCSDIVTIPSTAVGYPLRGGCKPRAFGASARP